MDLEQPAKKRAAKGARPAARREASEAKAGVEAGDNSFATISRLGARARLRSVSGRGAQEESVSTGTGGGAPDRERSRERARDEDIRSLCGREAQGACNGRVHGQGKWRGNPAMVDRKKIGGTFVQVKRWMGVAAPARPW